MILSVTEIKALIDDEGSGLIVKPFDSDRLQGASYDLRVGKRLLISGQDRESDLSELGSVAIMPGDFAVIISNEYIEIPQDMVINIGPKTYLTKKGIVLQAGMQIDPGFKGYLILGLYNSSPRKYVIEYLGDICSIQFFKLQQKAKRVFIDRSDYIRGEFPRETKDYLYSLETKSLTALGEDVRALTRNIASMGEKISDIGTQVNSLSIQVGSLKTIIIVMAIPLSIGLLLLFLQFLLAAIIK
jgi:deoxycytidine triphosphate deaminase